MLSIMKLEFTHIYPNPLTYEPNKLLADEFDQYD